MRSYKKTDGKLLPDDIVRVVHSIVTSNKMEGLENTPEEVDMLRKYVQNDISEDEYKNWILQHAG